jgi:transcriptional regulator with XRE-family HTH domain
MGMSTLVNAQRLRWEMTRRGWLGVDLARQARISEATVSAALSGRSVSTSSVALIAKALSDAPIIEGVDDLLSPTVDL